MSKLSITYDLMQHFKVMKNINAEKQMHAACDHNRKAFLSITTNGTLRMTSDENLQSTSNNPTSGWMQKDLSSSICAQVGEHAIVTSFSIGESRINDNYILCAVVSSGTESHIFYSLSKCISNPQWKKVSMPPELEKVSINNIQINGHDDDLYIIIYAMLKNNRLQRYFLRSIDGNFSDWSFLPLAIDFDTIASTVMGAPEDEVQGSYTLGKMREESQILFTPSYNVYSPGTAPTVARFTMPEAATPEQLAAFAVPEEAGATDLFACGNGVLSVYAYTDQADKAEPIILSQSEYFDATKQLFAYESKNRVYVWLLNKSKELCYLYADLEHRYDPNSWSVVMVLRDGLDYVHLFKEDNCNAFYGYTSEGTGILGYEDADNGLWSYMNVFTDVETGETVPIRTFITNINTPTTNETITIVAKANGLFEINGRLYSLNKNNSIRVRSDVQRNINIVQLTELFYAIELEVTYKGIATVIKPDDKTTTKLLSLDSPSELRAVKILTPSDPTPQTLIPMDTPDTSVDATAKIIQSLSAQHKILTGASNDILRSHQEVHLRYSGGQLNIIDDTDHDILLSDLNNTELDKYSSEDVFSYLRSQCNSFDMLAAQNGWFDILVKVVDDVCRFVVKTVQKTISFAIDCVAKVVSTAKEILTILVTDPKKILDFMKYMFDFDDIRRTKQYMSMIVNSKLSQCHDFMNRAEQMMNTAFEGLEKNIATWGGLDTSKLPNDTLDHMQSKHSNEYSNGNVYTNYLTNLVTANATHMDSALSTSLATSIQSNGPLDGLLEQLRKFAKLEGDTIKTMVIEIEHLFTSIKVDAQFDLAGIFKKILAIMGKELISAVKGVANLILDICKCLVDSVIKIINKTIYIPCVSEFLKMVGISSFSLLDIILFIPSFVGTIIFKLLHHHAPITDFDLKKLTNQLDNSNMLLQDLEYDKNLTVNITDLITGLLLFVEAGVASIRPAFKIVVATIAFTATLLQTNFLPKSEKTLDILIWYFGGIQLFFSFISVHFSSVNDILIEKVFAIISTVFHAICLLINVALFVYDISIKAIYTIVDSIKSIIDDLVTALDIETLKPDAALVLRLIRAIVGGNASMLLIVSAVLESDALETSNLTPILT